VTIWNIYGFDAGPHGDQAYIEAATLEEAFNVLEECIKNVDDRSDTVWKPTPREEWRGVSETRPLVSVLGAGCR